MATTDAPNARLRSTSARFRGAPSPDRAQVPISARWGLEATLSVGLRYASEKMTPPSREAILARVRALDTLEVAKARLQTAQAAALVDPVPGAKRIDNALEVVQIDHTPVDVIALPEVHRLPIGRPCQMLAIRVATRVVVGFCVSLEAPSSTTVALCLTQAVMPKEPWRRRGCASPDTWPAAALPADTGQH